jgi:NTE family protein
MNATPARAVTIALALQGGGAHGAFTWGVLDRLLEEPWLSIEGISATSSGAMNALALAQGWLDGGAQNDERGGARATLEALWESIAAETSALRWAFAGPTGSTAETMLLGITRHFTPKEINPLDFNPVREIAAKLFDFERLREAKQHLFLAATRVRDGRLAMFDREHLSLNALLASVCLPQLFAPVEIDGEMYWDGGYAGNPALEPLIYQCKCPDLLSVLVQPLEHSQPPTTMRQINERIVELGFSTTFTREVDTLLRAKDSLDRAFAISWIGRRVKALRLHVVDPGESLDDYGAKTRLNTRLGFLRGLRDLGRAQMQSWLETNADALGRRGTFLR